MDSKQVLENLTEVFRDVLDNEEIILSESTTADDIEEWDSLSHVQLVVAIEHEFDIRFSSVEIMSWKTVGDMANCIMKKKA